MRRLSCQMNISKSRTACNCMCEKYSPVLFVPFSVLDEIGLKNELRPVAEMLCAEANVGASLRRAGLQRGDLFFEAIEKWCPKMPKSHRVRFAIRPEKVSALLEEAGPQLMTDVSRTLERAEYEVNVKMLADLKRWLEKYRSIQARNRPKMRDEEASPPEPKHRGPAKISLCCSCGHAEMWHVKPVSEAYAAGKEVVDAGASMESLPRRMATSTCLMQRVPINIAKRLPLQESFPMIAGAAKPQAPRRVHSDPMICSGSLWMTGAATLERDKATSAAKTPPDDKPTNRRAAKSDKSRSERRNHVAAAFARSASESLAADSDSGSLPPEAADLMSCREAPNH